MQINFILKKIVFLLFLISSFKLSAAVWIPVKAWTPEEEMNYAEWIRNSFDHDIFSNEKSPYYGLKTDCADAALMARAIYAYENGLPFSFVDVHQKIISSLSHEFDHLKDKEKILAFFQSFSDAISAFSLASKNTISVHPKDVRPGDFYIVEWKNASGKSTFHAYIIKDFLPTGHLVLYSSTTPKIVRKLSVREGLPLRHFSSKPFGFKRFKTYTSQSEDFTQYEWLKLSEDDFYKKFREFHKSIDDTYQDNFSRRFKNVCRSLMDRVELVYQASKKQMEINNRCMNSDDFDQYSTPSRDQGLLSEIERIRNAWYVLSKNKLEHNLTSEEALGLDFLIGKTNDENAREFLNLRCKIEFFNEQGEKRSLSLKFFYDRLKQNQVSSNPNDSIDARFGLASSSHKCQK